MGPALLGLLDNVAASSGMQGVASREYSFVETSVGAKPTLACIGNAGVVGASSWLDAVFMEVLQDKGTASRGHRKLVFGKVTLPPRHHASSSWAPGRGDRHVAPSSPPGHGRHQGCVLSSWLRVVGSILTR